jgi:hypothetical protein
MRKFLAGLACLSLMNLSQAQVSSITTITPGFFIPSPFGIILSVGKWLLTDERRVYYIEVAGIGDTEAQARTNGFRLAVEQALGSLIASETQAQNGRINRDEIISYAAGFVNKFEIVDTKSTPRGVQVTMRVWVERSALADRLLTQSQADGTIDGPRATYKLDTLNQERRTGDALVQQVLNDFPQRAFDIEMGSVRILRENRQAYVQIPFKLSWSQNYLRSLWTAVEATSQKTSTPVSVIAVNSGSIFRDYGGQARFDDTVKIEQLYRAMILSRPNILVTIKNADQTTAFLCCFGWQELDHESDYNQRPGRFVKMSTYAASAFVDGAFTLNSVIIVPPYAVTLNDANTVELKMVKREQCPKR